MKELPHTRSCFVCGESNPIGLRLRFESDGRVVRVRFVPRPEHVGFKEIVHGGLTATLLDELMVWACALQSRRFAFCAELNVRFLKPLRPGEEVQATGEMVENRRNKIFVARAEMKNGSGVVLATATGKYLPIEKVDVKEMATDFIGDASWIFEAT